MVLWFSASVALLICTLVLRASWLRSLLEQPWIVLVGKRSYAMYLIHVLVIHSVERLASLLNASKWYVVVPVAYLASFAGATILFYTVERPCLAYGRKLSKRIRAREDEQLRSDLPGLPYSTRHVQSNNSVEPIEREEPGVPNAFPDEEKEASMRIELSWPLASTEEENS